MAISNVTNSAVVIGTVEDHFIGGVTSSQFRASIESINVNDPASCQAACIRCSNRCNGNDVDVDVKAMALTQGGDPQTGNTAESFSVSFRINE